MSETSTGESKDTIDDLNEFLKKEFGACPLCGKRTLSKDGEREWCKNCGWKNEPPDPEKHRHH